MRIENVVADIVFRVLVNLVRDGVKVTYWAHNPMLDVQVVFPPFILQL